MSKTRNYLKNNGFLIFLSFVNKNKQKVLKKKLRNDIVNMI